MRFINWQVCNSFDTGYFEYFQTMNSQKLEPPTSLAHDHREPGELFTSDHRLVIVLVIAVISVVCVIGECLLSFFLRIKIINHVGQILFWSWSDPFLALNLCCFNLESYLGNVLVVVSFARVRRLRRVHGNLFIISLAIADLIVGCQTLPIIAINVYFGKIEQEEICYTYSDVWSSF